MSKHHLFYVLLILLYVGAAVTEGSQGRWWKVLYWISSVTITLAVMRM